jgi:hypothetical protein
MTTKELRTNGFTIYPIGRKICFVDTRNGYTSPCYKPEICEEKLLEYMGAHRITYPHSYPQADFIA